MAGKQQRKDRPYKVTDTVMSPAQQTMQGDAVELSREGFIQRQSEVVVDNILTGAPKKLRLHPSDWALVRQLVRQAIREGIALERDL